MANIWQQDSRPATAAADTGGVSLVSSTVERVNGLLDALRDQGKSFNILKTYQAVEPIAGRKAGEAILRDFPERNSIDAIFTVNDGGGLAVAMCWPSGA